MRYILKEMLIFIGTLCSIYAVIYLFINDDIKCQIWAIFVAVIVAYVLLKICRAVLKRKNLEIDEMAKRKSRLEELVLGDKRQSSGYDQGSL